jgi:hypothetical protein
MKPSKKPIKLTPSALRSIIEEETKGFGAMKDVESCADEAEETDADELAGSVERPVDWQKANKVKETRTLDEHMDYVKGLKMEEARLVRRLLKLREAITVSARRLVVSRVV